MPMFPVRWLKHLCVRTFASSVGLAFGMVALSSGVSAVPALASTKTPAAPQTQATAASGAPAWLAAAMPYVHVTNFIATVDPRIDKVLSSTQVAVVKADVSAYNSAPLSLRAATPAAPYVISLKAVTPMYYSGCYGYIAVHSYNWWGVQFYLNDCYAQGIALGVGLAAVAATALYLVPGIDILAVALQIDLGLAAGSIMWADQHCGWRGVYLNVPWVPASVWGSPIC